VPHGSGAVNVLYAGSLVNLMEKQIGPAFDSATGFTFTGFSAGSTALATQIKGQVHAGDVFVSASPSVNDSLTGDANGNWVSWYATFASSPLVIGYNPDSRFAADLKSKPWYEVLTEPGILIGSTDPATDPKGKLAAQALTTAGTQQDLPALGALATDQSIVYPEETLVSRLQSGQLDVGFFYSSEATAANIATVPLTGQDLKATYTVTVLNKAPNEAGGEAFIQYLLGADGLAVLQQDGFTLTTPPTITGTGVPQSLSSTVLPG
jgi:molybdate/tungstate transport system substrate-binding protein